MEKHNISAIGTALVYMTVILGCFYGCEQEETGDLLLSDIHVVNVIRGELIESQDVLIVDGRIKRIIPHGQGNITANLEIKATGKYVMPGFWDMHVHFRTRKLERDSFSLQLLEENKDLLPLYVANGVTSVYDMGTDIIDSLRLWRDQIHSGKIIGPNIYLTGPKIEGNKAIFAGSIKIGDRDDVKNAIAQLTEMEVGGVKIMGAGDLEVENYYELLKLVKKQGLQSFSHDLEILSAEESSNQGLSALAHLRGIIHECFEEYDSVVAQMNTKGVRTPFHPEYNSYVDFMISRLDTTILRNKLDKMALNGTALISTVHYNAYRATPSSYENVFFKPLRYVGPLFRRDVKARYERFGKASAQQMDYIKQVHQGNTQVLNMLPKTSAILLVGTDAGFGNRAPGTGYFRELEVLASGGLSNAYILKAATWNAARFAGMSESEGTVDIGKKADLVLLEKNPLGHLPTEETLWGVIRNGEWFGEDRLQGILKSLEEKHDKNSGN